MFKTVLPDRFLALGHRTIYHQFLNGQSHEDNYVIKHNCLQPNYQCQNIHVFQLNFDALLGKKH